MQLTVPAGHKVGMEVPVGGSDCAKCEYVSRDETRCGQPNFQQWNHGDKLPAPADRFCCDFFSTAKRQKTVGEALTAQRARK